jgi:site-specific recombinase XerD
MTARIRDCARCGRGVARADRDLCARCHWAAEHAPVKQTCPRCGKNKTLNPETDRCARCSRTCGRCDAAVLLKDRDLCTRCHRDSLQEAKKAQCPRCGKPGIPRETTGWCGPCSHPGRPPNPDTACVDCGTITRLTGAGRCQRCWNRSPHRVPVRAANIIDALDNPPRWLADFAAYLAPRHHPRHGCAMLTRLGRLLADHGLTHPQTLLERAVLTDIRLARALEDFFTSERLALPIDWEQPRAAQRRRRRVDAVPEPLRAAAAAFAEHLLASRERARKAGTHPRKHATVDARLNAVRDLAVFLATERGTTDWATVDVADIEAFLHTRPSRRAFYLVGLRQFFGFAARTRRILIDPTRELTAPQPWGFRGPTLTRERQRILFHRWCTAPDAHPHEALVGLLALLHGATTTEIQHLTDDTIDHTARSVRLGHRPHATPLDPWTWTALQRCITHRETLRSSNPHLLITRRTKATRAPASNGYIKHSLDPVGLQPRILRSTRLADLVTTVDAKLVAAAYGMTNEAVTAYLADHVDAARLPNL